MFNMQFTLKVLTSIYVSLFVVTQIEGTYDVPKSDIEALKPLGLRFSLEDDASDIKFVELHANLNKPIKENEEGDIFYRVTAPTGGKWQLSENYTQLKKGDVFNYWVKVWNKDGSYTKHGLSHTVKELVE